MFGDEGLINQALTGIGLMHAPIDFFGFGRPAIVITFVYLLFPLSFLATYIAIERINPAMLDAAADLGARPWRRLVTITLPTARSGIVAGFVFAFIAMMGDYATPQLIGGTNGTLYANLITNQFGYSLQWGFGATLAVLFLVTILLLVIVLRLMVGGVEAAGEYTGGFTRRRAPFLFGYSVLYLIFLYTPPALLVLLAFNNSDESGLPFVGFTTRWFAEVFNNPVLLDALWTSLQVAISAVLISAVFGTLAAVQIVRVKGRLRSFNLGMISVPLFLPPLVLGLAIIVGLNALGLQRGLWTIIAGHTILTLPVVTLLVLVRLEGLDRNQEIAAMDLGARPWRAFLTVSVPQALPGILAGVMIAFAISMDEFILTFLVTGSQQTLPLYIFGSLRIRVTPELNAISALMLGASFAAPDHRGADRHRAGEAARARRGGSDDAAHRGDMRLEHALRSSAGDVLGPALTCTDLRLRYPGQDLYAVGSASVGVSFSVNRGELFALLGPSGCGKTTTLRIIGGFIEPTTGKVEIEGVDVTRHQPYERPTNTVFQSYALFPHLRVEGNVAYGLKMEGVPRAEQERRVREALDLVGLSGMERRRIAELSGGQQQRVALARALVKRPAVLLLDEPLGALDLKVRRQMQDELVRIKQSTGTTLIHVTHDQEEACAIADRIAVMKDGMIVQVDTPEALYRAPRNCYVAEFHRRRDDRSRQEHPRRRLHRGVPSRHGVAEEGCRHTSTGRSRSPRVLPRNRIKVSLAKGSSDRQECGAGHRRALRLHRIRLQCACARERAARGSGGADDR